MQKGLFFLSTVITLCALPLAHAQSDADLAKALSNPIAALISVPLQNNYDQHIGPADEGRRFTLNTQPVVPVTLNLEWNLISRTVVPLTDQKDIFPGAGSQFGLGDILQSVFFSPQKPSARGIIWGAGPVLLIPTATNDLLGAKKWGAGPTAVVLKQEGGWTYGALANHIWSFAGRDERPDISSTYLQPFVAFTTPDAWTFGLNTESTYNWKNETWTVPINITVTKMLKFGRQPVQIGGGVRYWADSPDSGPKDFGFRFVVTFLFPR